MKPIKPPFLIEAKKELYLREAEPYRNLTYDFLWEIIPTQNVPRAAFVTYPGTIGCLHCEKEIHKHGRFPYQVDFYHHPWKITCPNCGYSFPTNDFASYYRGGLDEKGFFDPKLAKQHNDALIAKGERGNLVNVLYPEKGETWGVDEGTGYLAENGYKYVFAAYYAHQVWCHNEGGDFLQNALRKLINAYYASEDVVYVQKAIVLLDRVADIYPSLDMEAWPKKDGYANSNGGSCDKGKAVGRIWETGVATSLLRAILTFCPLLKAGKLSDAVAFLQQKNAQKRSADAVYDNIMNGIVAEIYPGVCSANIYGNSGMHQTSLALAAVAWDRLPETKEWLDYLFRSGTVSDIELTGGNLQSLLFDRIDRDGYGDEASPGYNSIWLNGYQNIADALDGYELDGMEDRDLYNHPKYRKMLTTMYPLIVSDIYTSNIGDAGATGNPHIVAKLQTLIKSFLRYEDPIFAQAAYYICKNDIGGMDLTGFSESPDVIREKIEAVIAQYGLYQPGCTLLTGYGFAALRDGDAGDMFVDPAKTNQRSIWLYFGRNMGHGHLDKMNLGIHAYGMDLSPELGYPRYADALDKHRVSMTKNTVSHNTVVVNDTPQTASIVGDPIHYDITDFVKLIDVADEGAYRDTVNEYRRTAAMLKIDAQDSYIVDFFRVSGGEKHCYSFHGAEQWGIETTGLSLTSQTDAEGNYVGTYAGCDLPYPINADVEDLTGARYLINVDRQTGSIGDFSVDYSICDTWNVLGAGAHAPTDVHLKLSMLGNFDEVTLADCIPPENKPGNPNLLRYVLAIRKGDAVKSCYTALIEPYCGTSKIASFTALPVTKEGSSVCPMEARAVKVTLTNGRVDYIVNAVDPAAVYTVFDGAETFTFSGFFGVWSRENGQDTYFLHDGTQIGSYINCGLSAITGSVVDFTRIPACENEIIVETAQHNFDPRMLCGKLIHITKSEIGRNAAYLIQSAAFREDGMLVLHIGDVTPIRAHVDEYDFSKGYLYDIIKGNTFQIPLTNQ